MSDPAPINQQRAEMPPLCYGPITVETIRQTVQDRDIADNMLSLDLRFTDEEICTAMMNCARSYNGTPPYVHHVSPADLPGDTDLFLLGTLRWLYSTAVHRLSANDFTYSAGNVDANFTSRLIERYATLSKECGQQFAQRAAEYKRSINLSQMWGYAG